MLNLFDGKQGVVIFTIALYRAIKIAFAALLVGVSTYAVTVAQAQTPSASDIMDAVVQVHAMVPEDARTAEHLGTFRDGSGIVIDDDGLIVTIGYVIMESTSLAITRADGGDPVPADMVAYDHNTGFGLLRTREPLQVKPVVLGSSADLEEGGTAMIVSRGDAYPVTPAQVVSRREFTGYWEYLLEDAIFTMPPHRHFGGAALINEAGKLVGIGSLYVNDAAGPETMSPGNMFVPIDALKPILADLVQTGRSAKPANPWLGIYTDQREGRVLVTRVAAEGPAWKAGIKAGDIIIGVGGHRVSGMPDFLRRVWAHGEAGAEVVVDVLSMDSSDLEIKHIPVRSRDRRDWLKLN